MKQDPRVLVVDDEETNLLVMEELLEESYELRLARDGTACLKELPEFDPEVILLDIMMPGLDGYEVCKRIKAEHGDAIQIILVSARASASERVVGYQAGADDYVVKPFDHDELVAKLRVHVKLRRAMRALADANQVIQDHNDSLEQRIRERSKEVLATRDLAVFALAKLAESRDNETGEHLERMREYSQILARELARSGPYRGQIDSEFLNSLYLSSPLHDIGKVGIPDVILLKPDRLNDSEFALMKRHTTIGADILRETMGQSHGAFLRMAYEIAEFHHERFDGSGYPHGLRGTNIPLSARIVAVADVFDALTSQRPYKEAIDPLVARSMVVRDSGSHFDPEVITAFESIYESFLPVLSSCQDVAFA